MEKICFVSIDVEPDFGKEGFVGVEHLVDILDILQQHNTQATLFVTGEVLTRYKEQVKEWAGFYEIACHGFSHRFWDALSYQDRMIEIDEFNALYEATFGQSPRGFRAPSHLVDEAGLAILEKRGFVYDSSVVPHYPFFKKYRGYKGPAPLLPYHPSTGNCREAGSMDILEIPVSGQLFGVPLAGAWISRPPHWFYQFLFRLNRPSFLTVSMHPWNVLNPPGQKTSAPQFLEKLDLLLTLLQRRNYRFLNGQQITERYAELFGD